MFDPSVVSDACGTGFVASLGGVPSHAIVEGAVEAVVNLTHRGAVNADPDTGDGAGVAIQLPYALIQERLAENDLPAVANVDLCVAVVFLPSSGPSASTGGDPDEARQIIEKAVNSTELKALCWRKVPVDTTVLGQWARAQRPDIEQLIIARPQGLGGDETEKRLYLARRRAERAIRSGGEPVASTYIASMSAESVVYKGLMLASQLGAFYPDLHDPRVISSFALFHQRYATNTLPDWRLAQPLRKIAHNGEINTLGSNVSWMEARGVETLGDIWQAVRDDVLPVVSSQGSDSAALDEVFDLLTSSGIGPIRSMMTLIPEAWERFPDMDAELRSFYRYHAAAMEPWDGPATVAFHDGEVVGVATDRNGLRPARYQTTVDGLIVCASEAGVLDLDPANLAESGQLGPGQVLAVDLARRLLLRNDDAKHVAVAARAEDIAHSRAFDDWRPLALELSGKPVQDSDTTDDLDFLLAVHGYTREEIGTVLGPMAANGKEAVGSMGDDTPLSVLQDKPRLLYTYLRQRFAQVTNPPIDPIREANVMSMESRLGQRPPLLGEAADTPPMVQLPSPVLTDEGMAGINNLAKSGLPLVELKALFDAGQPGDLEEALERLCQQAADAVDNGARILVVTDAGVSASRAPIPMLLASSAVHRFLVRTGRRMKTGLVAAAGDARDVHQVACLVGCGADAVYPYLAFRALRSQVDHDESNEAQERDPIDSYVTALNAGLRKIMSKMGICTIASYTGSQLFEALGLAPEIVEQSFPAMPSRIGGIGYEDVARDVQARLQTAALQSDLEAGGWYKYRRQGDHHAYAPPVWRALQKAATDGEAAYPGFSEQSRSGPPVGLKDLLTYEGAGKKVALEKVEPRDAITTRFRSAAMSVGALGIEAHRDVATAMRIVGGFSNCGEGGELPAQYLPNGDKLEVGSQIKQVASGRFGVTPGYLAAATEIEIKMAQGSKPGEGGHLPGEKVTDFIALLRHSEPGIELISPPPHHDIYSIEDLAQLIYDLKSVNPDASVAVKLVASYGVGIVAVGVAKAGADVVHISGNVGGTGASPLSSIKYAGLPWEMGVKEAHDALVANGLRSRVRIRTDGGLRTGHDVVVATMLGAQEFTFGTAALVALGCKMARQCHQNTCPVGIATQREDLRSRYKGKPEHLVSFLQSVADEARGVLAGLGYTSLEQVVGRNDLLVAKDAEPDQENGLPARSTTVDLSALLAPAPPVTLAVPENVVTEQAPIPSSFENKIIRDAEASVQTGEPTTKRYLVRNVHRAIGAGVAGMVARQHGDRKMSPGLIRLHLEGTAGQSLGAFMTRGMRIHLEGQANDYVGKGMAGGIIAIVPQSESYATSTRTPSLAGNTLLYGATGGSLFIAGTVGERFAVRNSGARSVVEGVGDHACSYMTGGKIAVLGPIGNNFAAGMSRGVAYIWDPTGESRDRVNQAMAQVNTVSGASDKSQLKMLLRAHWDFTGSAVAKRILSKWDKSCQEFLIVVPRQHPDIRGEKVERVKALVAGTE
jgi:glutamate synthase (ferredoxin)